MKVQIDPMMRIDIYSHFFKVTKFTPRILSLLFKFSSKFTEPTQQRNGPAAAVPKTFATKTKNNLEFRFHVGQLKDFMQLLQYEFIEPYMYDVIRHGLYRPEKLKLTIRDNWTLKDYQEEAKTFILDEEEDSDERTYSRLATLPTGTGKTVTAMATALSLNQRIMITVLPRYSEKWLSDVVGIADVKAKEVMNIAGGDSLRGLISMAQEGQPLSKIIVFSLTTLQMFYKDYEEHPEACRDKWGCVPEELHQLLSIGTLIIDEAHEHLHAFFKMMMYTHCPKLIALSGTYLSGDPFIDNMQKLIFPRELRYDKIKMEKYIKVYPISYAYKNFPQAKIKTTEFNSNNYSQVAYEKSIMKNPTLLKNYLGMIDHLVDFGYNRPYMEGDKLGIYAGSVAMCTHITDYLKEKYPDKDVRRYVEKDSYENVIKPDIRVTTIISAGTAIDIPGLRAVIMTPSVNSPVANLQTLGRLRKLPDRDVKFFYTWCQDIKKQADYHYRRMDLFKDRVALIKEFKSPVLI